MEQRKDIPAFPLAFQEQDGSGMPRTETRRPPMTDRYAHIREALAMGPTPGPWVQDGDGVSAYGEDVAVAVSCPSDAEAAFIAACDPDTIRELLEELDALRKALGRTLENEASDKQKSIARAWNEGFDFAMKACGWQEGEDPATEGLYVARDSKGDVDVGMWYAKTVTQPAEWTREFRDVDRDDIVAWMAIPDWRTARDASKLSDAMLRAQENTNDH